MLGTSHELLVVNYSNNLEMEVEFFSFATEEMIREVE